MCSVNYRFAVIISVLCLLLNCYRFSMFTKNLNVPQVFIESVCIGDIICELRLIFQKKTKLANALQSIKKKNVQFIKLQHIIILFLKTVGFFCFLIESLGF